MNGHHNLPPHVDDGWPRVHCGCTGCETWRAARVVPGALAHPATNDPKRMSPGTVPAWPPGLWSYMGWTFRLEAEGIGTVLVVGAVGRGDASNAGHLDCVVVVTLGEGPRVLVTSKKWLFVPDTAAASVQAAAAPV